MSMINAEIATKKVIVITGVIGLLASVLVGFGELLLHYNDSNHFSDNYDFLQGISDNRSTIGHFISVLAAPLYILGFWHIMKMLEPANKLWSKIGFLVMSYGIIVGAVWIGSRANISAIINHEDTSEVISLISLYELRYNNLLLITRLCVLIFSGIFVFLVLSGRTYYSKWIAFFNPFFLILVIFAIWTVVPIVGKYLMPAALNVAFGLLFLISIYFSNTLQE